MNPENMLVSAISSAHMLSWLNVAFGMGIEVVSYLDQAHGVLTELTAGCPHQRITRRRSSSSVDR